MTLYIFYPQKCFGSAAVLLAAAAVCVRSGNAPVLRMLKAVDIALALPTYLLVSMTLHKWAERDSNDIPHFSH